MLSEDDAMSTMPSLPNMLDDLERAKVDAQQAIMAGDRAMQSDFARRKAWQRQWEERQRREEEAPEEDAERWDGL